MADKHPRPRNFHMDTASFRRHGHDLIDWIADYYERVENFPVLSQAQPGELRAALPPSPPVHGEDFASMMADVERLILPGITHWQSPNFFAFFPANTSFPAILGDLLSSGLGVQGMLWATSPACTELETHVLDWVAQLLDLPPKFRSDSRGGGVIQDTASSATLCALLVARERATDFSGDARGCNGGLLAYTSTQAHSSIEKAARIAGIGKENLRLIPVDEHFAMQPAALAEQIARDRVTGKIPFFVTVALGTTSSLAIDPLAEIADICRQQGLWCHVDAAMAGSAAICPEFRGMQQGLENVDSYCFNPHKWLFTNFDCDCFFVADRAALIKTLSVLPEYLRNQATESGAVIDYRDWQIPLGRRFRALKLWFVIRHYGVAGLQHHIRRHVALTHRFADWVSKDPRFELAAPVQLNLVCFRLRGDDAVNQTLLERLNASGALYLTHTKLAERFVLRFCIGQTHTEERHVETAWRRIQSTADALLENQA